MHINIKPVFESMGVTGNDEWIEAFEKLSPELIEHYGMSGAGFAHKIAQTAAETDGLRLAGMVENHRYKAERAAAVFKYRIGLARDKMDFFPSRSWTILQCARHLVNGQSEDLFNCVYGWRMGNGPPSTGHGHRYRGRGPWQITGRDNYARITAEIRRQPGGANIQSLVDNPHLVASIPEIGVRASFADFALKGVAGQVRGKKDDYKRVSALLNTGSASKWSIVNGKSARREWTLAAFEALEDQVPAISKKGLSNPKFGLGAVGDHVAKLQRQLTNAGYPVGKIDGHFGKLTQRQVESFQRDLGISVGHVGDRTREALALYDQNIEAPRENNRYASKRTPAKTRHSIKSRLSQVWIGLFGTGTVLQTSSMFGFIPDVSELTHKVKALEPLIEMVSRNPLLFALALLIGVGALVVTALMHARDATRKLEEAYANNQILE